MKRAELIAQIEKKKSVLCVGLDTDIKKIPKHLLTEPDPIFSFNKAIIDATVEYSVAYKPNIAFYESLGVQGWNALNKTINYLNQTYPEVFTIADAKRGDIGNTSKMYAEAFFETMNFVQLWVGMPLLHVVIHDEPAPETRHGVSYRDATNLLHHCS